MSNINSMDNNLKHSSIKSNRNHLEWVLIAKGIGIFLVVVGHFFPVSSPVYWVEMRKVIYTFHMPLFFLLSGYLYSEVKYSYSSLVANKVRRLLFPFVSIAIIFFIIKYISGLYVTVNYPVNLNSLRALIIDPVNSYMPLLWFVHTLFIIFIIYPLFRLFLNKTVILIIVLSANIFFSTEVYIVNNVLEYVPYFIVGALLKDRSKFTSILTGNNYFILTISLFLFMSVYLLSLQGGLSGYNYLIKFLLGMLGSVFIINISKQISNSNSMRVKNYIVSVGVYSMSIYLFHTLFESAVRIGLSAEVLRFSISFELVAVLAVLAGMTFPLLLEKYFLSKNSLSRKYNNWRHEISDVNVARSANSTAGHIYV